ncbi:MAG: flagellar basal body P-ring formation chaperone FlgA [Desulfobacteraceae bacterium]|nr:flagellar basal body P-ring formation chaperone FlgA [Desulfobacteraceae bacterium]
MIRAMLILPLVAMIFLLPLMAVAEERQPRILGGEELAAIFREIVLADASFPAKDLEITGFTAEPSTLMIPAGAVGYRLINQVHGEHLGRKGLQVAILVDGKEFGTVRMQGDLKLFGEVACAAKAMPRDTVLSADDINVVRRDITFLGAGVVTDAKAVVGKRLRVSVQPGAILYNRNIEEVPLVQRGDLVTIVARSGQLEVTAPGQARNAGASGDLIPVKNLMSRKIIQAKVQQPGLVEVEF